MWGRSFAKCPENGLKDYGRIPTVKLKIPGKLFLNTNPEFLYIQVIVFDLSYLPVAVVGTYQVRYHEKNERNIKKRFSHFFHGSGPAKSQPLPLLES